MFWFFAPNRISWRLARKRHLEVSSGILAAGFFSLLCTMLVGHDMHEFVKTWKTCAKWEYKIKTWYCKAPQMRSLLVLVQLISFTKQGMFDDMLHICLPNPSFKFNIQPAVQQHPQTPYSEDHPRTWTHVVYNRGDPKSPYVGLFPLPNGLFMAYMWGVIQTTYELPGGGFKYFLCSPLPGDMIQFD